ncbi:MAG TPA: DUF1800 domain-containing protein [Acidimicrobiales bacterium]
MSPLESRTLRLHVARRLSFGPTNALMGSINKVGTTQWIDNQLNWSAISESAIDPYLAKFPRASMTASQIANGVDPWMVKYDLAMATLIRAVWGKRQLYELLCDFWSNHFNIDVNHDTAAAHKPTDDRNVVRRHATGRFADMLVASAKSPAMLVFLDQASSRADGDRIPNENYARELLELHTVGIGGGYDEADIKEVAHLLTGWTLTDPWVGKYTFNPTWHDMGPLATGGSVLGWKPNGLTGQAAGQSFLVHLARHPKTANRLAYKLAVRFIGDHVKPTDAVVTNAAKAYTSNDTAIAPMVRSLLLSAEFTAAPAKKARRPFEYVAGSMRQVGMKFDPAKSENMMWISIDLLSKLGQVPHCWPAPNGYPDSDGKWLSAGAMVSRWNAATTIGQGMWLGMPAYDPARLLGTPVPTTVGGVIDKLSVSVLQAKLPASLRNAILGAVGMTADTPWLSWYNSRGLLSYVLQSPANQMR